MPLILLISMSAFLIPLSVRWPLPIKHAFHHLMILEIFCYIRSQFTGRLLYIFLFDVSFIQILLDKFSTVVKFIRYHVSRSVSLGYFFYCCDETPWPKAALGGKSSLALLILNKSPLKEAKAGT